MYLKTWDSKCGDIKNLIEDHQLGFVQGNDDIKYRSKHRRYALLMSVVLMLTMLVGTLTLGLVGRVGCAGRAEGAGAGAGAGRVLVCYYTPDEALGARRLHPHLCTHINVAFARVQDKRLQLAAGLRRALPDVLALKADNPQLKVLLSVGGAGNDNGFPEMIADHQSRKIFIKSLKYTLRNYSLDGVDLDWEFPGLHAVQSSKKRERQHFSQLLREIRMEYIRERRDYLLTVAVAAPQVIVDVAYDVDQLNMYVDFVNVMTYDYHFYSKFTPLTGLNSPLYPRSTEQLYFATLNVNYTVNMYLDKGLGKDKLVVGIPTYGHTFTLVNPGNTAIGSPASGYGLLGSQGFVNYPDICTFVKESNSSVVIKLDNETRVPYLYHGKEWVSYDTPDSVMEKAKYIHDMGLRGAMIYSLNADDFNGTCSEQTGDDIYFPLARTVKNSLSEHILI